MNGDLLAAIYSAFDSPSREKPANSALVKITCPECAKEIPLTDANPSTDVAICRACGKTFSFAELSVDATETDIDLTKPPNGTWVRELGDGFEVSATTRSTLAFFLIPFVIIWSGAFLGACYGSQISEGHFYWTRTLLGIPFLLITLVLITGILVGICGKIIVRDSGNQASVSIGVGSLRYTRRFRWSEIKRVRESVPFYRQNGRDLCRIELEREGKPIRFGSQLTEPRRKFLLAMLKRIHTAKR